MLEGLRRSLLAALVVWAAAGCTSAGRSLGAQCNINSDCQDPLVCELTRCRRACDVDRDCVPPAYCILGSETGIGSCALEDELRCALDSDCPTGNVCRLGTCTVECVEDRDCPPGAFCNTDDGDPFCERPEPTGCLYDSECPAPLVCGPDRRCRFECFQSSECAGGLLCVDNVCASPDAGSADAGPVTTCGSDAQCSDGVFCNGMELCRPGLAGSDDFGCAPPTAPACPADTMCDEGLAGCVSDCDRDGDGFARPGRCGGDDCADDDPTINPGRLDDCNYRDDDCDGLEDEDVDLGTDVRHCGFCDNGCAVPNGVGRCVSAVCELDTCFSGFADLDGVRSNGCEHICDPMAVDACNGADEDCDGSVDEDPATMSCSTTNAVPSCVAGACSLSCAGGFDDCNSDVRDGCEADLSSVSSCGGCGVRCGAALDCLGAGCESANVVGLTAGRFSSCLLWDNGRLACWGQNTGVSFGAGPVGSFGEPIAAATGPFDFARLSAGAADAYGCGIDAAGAISCWGRNDDGQAGVDPMLSTLVLTPTPLMGAMPSDQLDLGFSHGCAITLTDTVQCWGDNGSGELGQGTRTFDPEPIPLAVPGLSGVSALEVGLDHTCAVAGSELRCWGDNQLGESGGTACGSRCESPTLVAGIVGPSQLALGTRFTCVRNTAGEVWCFGSNFDGQLGAGLASGRFDAPVQVTGVTTAAQVVAGDEFACARLTDGSVQCWGDDRFAQLGDGTSGGSRNVPAPVMGLPPVVDLTAGHRHACARTATNEVWCWGEGGDGQLGDGMFSRSAVPTRVRGVP